MEKAVELSKKGGRAVFPNPMVGAIIFDDSGNIISSGYHVKNGEDHAEVVALKKIGFKAKGLNMVVTLEPCNHYGKTPPCSKAILNSGIKRIYIAAKETNKIACSGASFLEKSGVEVVYMPEFEKEVRQINKFFFKTVEASMPYVSIKVATGIDGFIALKNGVSKYLTGSLSKKYVHKMRSQYQSIAVGAKTVNSDNPSLTVRVCDGVNPRPVIFSRYLSLNPEAKILQSAPIIFTSVLPSSSAFKEFLQNTPDIISIENDDDFIKNALEVLWKQFEINSIIIEGGGKLLASFLNSGQVDEIHHYVAPLAMFDGIPMFNSTQKSPDQSLDQIQRFKLQSVTQIENDYLAVYRK